MSILSPHTSDATRIWLVDANPLHLDEPPRWWQTLVYDYDKMLRVMPSQREHAYRLCRLVRVEARLGLSQMVVHDHPDTRACIKFGVVPIATLPLWAVRSDKVIHDLQARDTWRHFGGDPHKITDAIERQEADAQAAIDREADAALDERSTNAYRAIRYGRPAFADLGEGFARHDRAFLPPLPALPSLPDLQNRDPVVDSALPPAGTPAPTPTGD